MRPYIRRTTIEKKDIEGEIIELLEIPDIVNATATIMRYSDGTLKIFFARSEENGGDIQVRCEPDRYSVEEEILPCTGHNKKFNYIWPEKMRGTIANYDSKARLKSTF